MKQKDRKIGYLLVGHGTRNVIGQQQFETVFTQFAQRMAPDLAELAFLELATPDIPMAIKRLAARGTTHLITVPVLLFSAGHALQDIPQEVAAAASDLGLKCLGQSPPLELHSKLLELSALRFRQAVCQSTNPPGCREDCQGNLCPHIGLALIGRGSRSDQATERMRQFAQLRGQITPVAQLLTGFVFAQSPTVVECLERLAGVPSVSQPAQRPLDPDKSPLQPHSIVVVQPHLLFEGELIEQLREQVAEFARRYTQQRWVVTETLGTDFALADTLASLARQVVDCGESG